MTPAEIIAQRAELDRETARRQEETARDLLERNAALLRQLLRG